MEKSENKRLRGPPGATQQALQLYRERFGAGSWRVSAGRLWSSEPNPSPGALKTLIIILVGDPKTTREVAAVWLNTTSWRSLGRRGFSAPLSVANQSLGVGNRSVLRRLSDGNRWFPIGYRPPKWGSRKYYLLLHQPESGWCGLQVIFFIP